MDLALHTVQLMCCRSSAYTVVAAHSGPTTYSRYCDGMTVALSNTFNNVNVKNLLDINSLTWTSVCGRVQQSGCVTYPRKQVRVLLTALCLQ